MPSLAKNLLFRLSSGKVVSTEPYYSQKALSARQRRRAYSAGDAPDKGTLPSRCARGSHAGVRSLGLRAAFSRPPPANMPSRLLSAGMRWAGRRSHDGQSSFRRTDTCGRRGTSQSSRHRARLTTAEAARPIAAIGERDHVTCETQWYLIRSRIDEIEGLDSTLPRSATLYSVSRNEYEFRHAKGLTRRCSEHP